MSKIIVEFDQKQIDNFVKELSDIMAILGREIKDAGKGIEDKLELLNDMIED